MFKLFSFDLERTWWQLFQKRVMCTQFDIYVLIIITGYHPPSASTLTWFIRYVYYWNLQFLNNVIMIKTTGILHQEYVTVADFGFPL
jgi:hypothetical protein